MVVIAYLYTNGMVIAFDENQHQVPDYQGKAEDCLHRIRADFPNAEIIKNVVWRGKHDDER